jgi:4-amino-4-deoxy-L-arabinose transferase-like glycosyltransferase
LAPSDNQRFPYRDSMHSKANHHPEYWISLALFALELVWGSAFALTTPPFEGPDEYYHYCYVALIARNKALPKPYPLTPVPYTDRHPPLYYLLGAALVWDWPVSCYQAPSNPFAVFDNSTPISDNRNLTAFTRDELQAVDVLGLRRVRLLSVFLGSLTIVFIYLSARVVFENNNLWAAATAVLVAALPPFAWISGFVNNDNLSIFMGTFIAFCCLRVVQRGAMSRRNALSLGLLAGAALMTKFSLWLFIPTLLAIILFLSLRTTSLKSSLVNALLFGVIMLAISAWWFIRNGLLVPALAGPAQLNWLGPIRWSKRPSMGLLLAVAVNQLTGVWDRYGFQVELPQWIQIAGVGLTVAAVVGLFIAWARTRFRLSADKPVFWVGLIGLLDLASGMYAVWLSRDAGQGRFLYPGIVSLSILMVLGWSQFWPKRWRAHRYPASIMGSMVVFALASFLGVYRTAYQLPQFYQPDKLPPGIASFNLNFENAAELVGASVRPTRTAPGAEVVVTACWKPISNSRDVFESVVLLDHLSRVVASRTTLPGLGRYRAADWAVGQTFCDDVTLRIPPQTATQNQYRVSVGLLGLRATQPDGQTVDPVIVGHLTLPSPMVKAPPEMKPLDASFDNGLSLLGYTFTYTSTAPGSSGQLHLFWKTASPLPDSYHVFVHWLDAQGRLIAQSDDIPCQGAYPTDAWGANEIIEDSHVITLTEGATAGASRFSIGMYLYPSGERLGAYGPLAQDNAITFPSADIAP